MLESATTLLPATRWSLIAIFCKHWDVTVANQGTINCLYHRATE
jgi:hypothetical protein